MPTTHIIEGLTILEKYRDKPDGYNTGAEYDILYAYATDRPLSPEDVKRMVELGWHQHEVDFGDGDFEARHYNPDEGWAKYT
jgi:hypothetical protein